MSRIEFENPNGHIKKYTLVFSLGFTPAELPGRDLWLAALRSGNFTQATGYLSCPTGDCCLGVFCKVLEFPHHEAPGPGEYFYPPGRPQLGSLKCFPKGNAQHAVFDGHGAFPRGAHLLYMNQYGEEQIATTLTCCNDLLGLTFVQIAELVEKLWIEPCKNSPASSGAPS